MDPSNLQRKEFIYEYQTIFVKVNICKSGKHYLLKNDKNSNTTYVNEKKWENNYKNVFTRTRLQSTIYLISNQNEILKRNKIEDKDRYS